MWCSANYALNENVEGFFFFPFVITHPLYPFIRIRSYKENDRNKKYERKQKMMKQLKKWKLGFSLYIFVIVWPSQNKESSCACHMGNCLCRKNL